MNKEPDFDVVQVRPPHVHGEIPARRGFHCAPPPDENQSAKHAATEAVSDEEKQSIHSWFFGAICATLAIGSGEPDLHFSGYSSYLIMMSRIERDFSTRQDEGPRFHKATTAADGLPRLAFTVDDVYRMVEAGILLEDERVELIDGELVLMNAKGNHHEVLKANLLHYFYSVISGDTMLVPETTFILSENTFLEPDITFYSRGEGLANLRSHTALLVIEISDSSLSYDLGRKAQLYARFGVQELWVIDAIKLITYVHLVPSGDRYKMREEKGPDEELHPTLIRDLTVTLGKLDLR